MKKAMVYVSSEQSDRGNLHSVGTYSKMADDLCREPNIFALPLVIARWGQRRNCALGPNNNREET